jgi:hypothetical protein
MIPLNELAAELVLAVGGALFVANLWVLLRPIVQRERNGPPPASAAIDNPDLREHRDRCGRHSLGDRDVGDSLRTRVSSG